MRIASVACTISMCVVCVLQAIRLYQSWKKTVNPMSGRRSNHRLNWRNKNESD